MRLNLHYRKAKPGNWENANKSLQIFLTQENAYTFLALKILSHLKITSVPIPKINWLIGILR